VVRYFVATVETGCFGGYDEVTKSNKRRLVELVTVFLPFSFDVIKVAIKFWRGARECENRRFLAADSRKRVKVMVGDHPKSNRDNHKDRTRQLLHF
jgi:hypothetical protein